MVFLFYARVVKVKKGDQVLEKEYLNYWIKTDISYRLVLPFIIRTKLLDSLIEHT